jgi:hypothetical protein
MFIMPSQMTHAYFALDVYDNLDDKTKKRLVNNKEQLKTFAQGSDILFFYMNCNYKKAKQVHKLGKYVHQHNSKDFFINLINYIIKNKLEKNSEVIAFLYGFITHYVLDSTIHPFIFYKTGIMNKKRKDTYKYNGLHMDMENYIDAYMIYTKEGVKPKDFKVYNFCFNVNSFSPKLSDTIDNTFKETFNQSNISNIYLKSIKDSKKFTHLIKYDPHGTKLFIYKLIDKLMPRSTSKVSGASYHVHQKAKQYYLNLEKNKWNNPVVQNEISDLSFIELYRISLQKCLNIIHQVNEVIYDKKDISILDEAFLDLSYLTGRSCIEKQKLQYFEF